MIGIETPLVLDVDQLQPGQHVRVLDFRSDRQAASIVVNNPVRRALIGRTVTVDGVDKCLLGYPDSRGVYIRECPGLLWPIRWFDFPAPALSTLITRYRKEAEHAYHQ